MNKRYILDGKMVTEACNPVFTKETQLLIAGLGSGGSFCAMAAARRGIRVLAFDRLSEVGGMNTVGLITGYYYGGRGGLYEEVDREAAELQKKMVSPKKGFRGEALAAANYRALCECGVELLFQTTVTALYTEGKRVVGAQLLSEGRLLNVRCLQMVDATSDGHAIRMSGASVFFGRETDGEAAPFSAYIRYLNDEGKLKRSTDDAGTIDPFERKAFTEKILSARRALTVENPGLTINVAELPGIREGLRFEGEDKLSFTDVYRRRDPEKVLLYAYSDLDKHGFDTAMDTEEFQDFLVVSNLSTVAFRIAVPFGAVVPKNVEGLTSACRALSVDAYAMSGIRMNRDMKRLGECVGIGLSLAIRNHSDFMNVDYESYCNEASNARMGDESRSAGFDNPRDPDEYRPIPWNMDFQEADRLLDSETPGAAVYVCSLNRAKFEEHLLERLSDPVSILQRNNAALVLGLYGRKEALPVLRDMVKNRSCLYYRDCRRTNQFPGVSAVCLLGRIGEKEDLRLLEPIVFSEEEYGRSLYHTLRPDYVFCEEEYVNFVYYQYFTHSVMAILKLAEKFGVSYRERFEKLLSGESRAELTRRLTENRENAGFSRTLEEFYNEVLKRAETG